MKEFLTSSAIVAALALVLFRPAVMQKLMGQVSTVPSTQPTQPAITQTQPPKRLSPIDRPLRLSVTVDDPSFLQVKEGDIVKEGDVIVDNKLERNRLIKQRQSIELHIENLKAKIIHLPFEPKEPLPGKPLPPPIFAEEEAAIAQAHMKLTQAQSVLNARTELLKTDNPERRAEMEKAEEAQQNSQEKVEEQEQLILNMKEMKLQTQILQHEQAKLKQLQSNEQQAKSELERAKAKLEASAIEQQQQLQQLQMAVKMAESELIVAKSKLATAKSRRQLLEYDASIEQTKRSQAENQTQQEFSRQMQQYEQAVREHDYQLAQLKISLSAIDDKISQISVLRSPKTGYIRRVKPWVGNNGKYTTKITISSIRIPESETPANPADQAVPSPQTAGEDTGKQ
ncbi:hypothetical protein G7B40_016900 [Aetokthonos hydrillicola Thurmond2011]|jgi:multidrug efflux pump subunit AcrA (membrane-fusion protein)|uniref:Uncharacterized protein n=2 Tax=Aetokthonos TaxID=1550243 RepID=A0AAP5I730_9CYAN|nr:hypothetical protein [Aetokthonos hydrillicola]MBO3463597.1 hypothetical protein [Aetokthonos hydrillicola CCALA 1050]MBW4591326.1 hypothetical protein [Aetokthonos hydrillicola CCALA 1050]MDR9896228.1 hypothetical protein [Aetokthonos hydrillicola Thurmond2011]